MLKKVEKSRMKEEYKVCILAAGVGSKLGEVSKYINPAVLPVNCKGAISYIIEKFPKDMEIVIALGHKKETVRDYLSIVHPDRKFTFVEVDKYIGPGAGPGYSLLQCKKHLQCPFIFFSSDTIVIEDIPAPDENWFGISPVKETEPYCTVKIKNNVIYQLDVKVKTDNKFAFIGLAGVKDYQTFFDALEADSESIQGEIQVTNGCDVLYRLKPTASLMRVVGFLALNVRECSLKICPTTLTKISFIPKTSTRISQP